MVRSRLLLLMLVLLGFGGGVCAASEAEQPRNIVYPEYPPAPRQESRDDANVKSSGCLSCHTATDMPSMHANPAIVLGCTDCHGGDAGATLPPGTDKAAALYRATLDKAHVQPRFPESWHYPKSANPERSYTLLNRESPQFIRFVNPSDYRVARESCGACHLSEIQSAERSMMATGAMLWGGATYNNGILPFKNYILGEAYTHDGLPAILKSPGTVAPWMTKERGILPQFVPLPAWETTPPGDIFRVFERGGRNIATQFPETGLPNVATLEGNIQRLEEPGRPDIRQSNRGPGTGLRIAVPSINIHKTRLNDPTMWFLGTNDQPGDYRSSGCAGCHVIYANDRSKFEGGPYGKFGNMGETQTVDPTIPKDEPGHPLVHGFTRAIPTSQCMVCHMHQPNIFLNSMLGYTMWDYESDAPSMWPAKQKYPTDAEMRKILDRNPEEASVHGKWADVNFLKDVSLNNPNLKNTQFADYHGHGWNFRAVFKKDRKGNMLDADGAMIAHDDPHKWDKAVQLRSIHVEMGMHCVDCHFEQDAHGNGYLEGEVANAIEIRCVDCHGTPDAYPTLRTSGPAAPPGGRDLTTLRTQDGRLRFEWRGSQCDKPVTESRDCKLFQRSAVNPDQVWEMHTVKDSVDPSKPTFNPRAARAKLMSAGASQVWGPGVKPEDRAHKTGEMECYTCHLSWTTSCAGCHLPIQANWKTERHHFEGGESRNFATYNPQVARDDMFQLGIHQTTKGNTIAPVRSSSALILSSTNINRERIYIQQPPISAAGYSSQAFAPHYPHTERKTETKTCDDCHVSANNDNNAIMAQLLLQGTNFVNFVGYNAWLGEGNGVEAVTVTEWNEPQAVIGSYLHRYAYPDWYKQHQDRGRKLKESQAHGGGETNCLQLRGEYLYTAQGSGGFRVYDVASIANKGISERIITAPFSPLGQDTHIASKDATCVALPTDQSIAPGRMYGSEARKQLMQGDNQEQPIHPLYSYAFITDAEEGLIAVNVDALTDGEPRNNFLTRAMTWNENGVLKGARHIAIAGTTFYVTADVGVVVLDMDDPLKPKQLAVIPFPDARATALQFRYLFVTDRDGLHVVDVTDPHAPRRVEAADVPLADAHRVYVARTFAYVADGKDGLAIVDVEKPEQPHLYQMFTGNGSITDARDVIVGTTNASLFAYVADGHNGLKVIQLTSPESQPNFYGFSPDPKPEVIAWWPTRWPALALSKGLDRDRAVDETGHQIAVFGRLGSRPMTLSEQQKLYLRDGKLWTVNDEVKPEDFVAGTPPRNSEPRKAAGKAKK
ncbi:MAG: hypothetical protein EPO08_06910 [Rhodospirillaceae bacterium]|nr:MAG: hypothetical protein EPO08_06910 [Rhodospirillaceae bacterium]